MSFASPSRTASKSISSHKRLEQMLLETEAELERLQPQIERLEKQIDRLRDLKFTKRKLIALRLSLQSILDNYGESQAHAFLSGLSDGDAPPPPIHRPDGALPARDFMGEPPGAFLPDRALAQAAQVLRRQSSLNLEIFRALAFQGGQATSAQIRQSLIERGVTLPSSGQSAESLSLSDISSRAHYLVRKGLAMADGRGAFRCAVGWQETPPAAAVSEAPAETPPPVLAE